MANIKNKRTESGYIDADGNLCTEHDIFEEFVFIDNVLRELKVTKDDYGTSVYKFDEKGREAYAYIPQQGIAIAEVTTIMYDEANNLEFEITREIMPASLKDKGKTRTLKGPIRTNRNITEEKFEETYNAQGLLERRENSDKRISYEYDDNGRCIKEVHEFLDCKYEDLGAIEVKDWDNFELGVINVWHIRKKISRQFDELGRLCKQIIEEYNLSVHYYEDEMLEANNESFEYCETRPCQICLIQDFNWENVPSDIIALEDGKTHNRGLTSSQLMALQSEDYTAKLWNDYDHPIDKVLLHSVSKYERPVPNTTVIEERSLTSGVIRKSTFVDAPDGKPLSIEIVKYLPSAPETPIKLLSANFEYDTAGNEVEKTIVDYRHLHWCKIESSYSD